MDHVLLSVFSGEYDSLRAWRHGDARRTASAKRTARHATGETHGRRARSNGIGKSEQGAWRGMRRRGAMQCMRKAQHHDAAEKTCKRNRHARCREGKHFPHSPSPCPEMMQKPLRVIEHYPCVVQFARDLLRSMQRDENRWKQGVNCVCSSREECRGR